MFSADNCILVPVLQRFTNQIHRAGKNSEFLRRKIVINVVAAKSGVTANENKLKKTVLFVFLSSMCHSKVRANIERNVKQVVGENYGADIFPTPVSDVEYQTADSLGYNLLDVNCLSYLNFSIFHYFSQVAWLDSLLRITV